MTTRCTDLPVAYDITEVMKYTGRSVEDAAKNIIEEKLHIKGIRSGVIAVDRYSKFVVPYNSEGIVRGVTTNTLEPTVAVN